jgi:hypothetical protein
MFYLDEVSGTKYWRFLWHGLDSNTTYTINYLNDAWKYEAWTWTYAITRYALCMMKADGTWEKITDPTANYSTWTTKNVNTHGFVLNQIKYYNTTTTVAWWGFVGTNTLASQAASVRADYSFNCGTAPWWSVWDPIYIVGTIWNDGLFYLDTTTRWSTTLPSTKDWKLYIRIGVALTTTDATITLLADRPILYYDNWIKEYSSSKANVVDVNTKTFTLSSTSDTTTAQAAYDWYAAWKNPIIILSWVAYNIIGADSSAITFEWAKSQYPTVWTSYSAYKVDRLAFALSSWTVTNISSFTTTLSTYLETSEDYTTAYTPTYDGSPATKKYVDDNAWIQNDTTWTTTTVTAIRAGSENEYNQLQSHDASTIYHIY